MAFVDLSAELTGNLPGLSPFLADTYIKRAWASICACRQWSFLTADAAIVCPGVVTAGHVAVTQYSAQVTLDIAASAALLPHTVVGAIPGVQTLQFRVAGAGPGAGQVYSILTANATIPTAIVLTLDRPVVSATASAATYQIYRAYVVPPDPNFLGWSSVVDVANSINLRRDRTSIEFDLSDPQRMSQGQAYNIGLYRGNLTTSVFTGATAPQATQNAGTPIFELWPVPTSGQTFYARYKLKAYPYGDFPTDELPAVIDPELVVSRALGWHAYPFAQANQANFPTLRTSTSGWMGLIQQAQVAFKEAKIRAFRMDDEQALQTIMSRGHGLRPSLPFGRFSEGSWPIDSNFMQSHLLRF